MAWHLAPAVTLAPVGDDLVFLDVEQDAYLCVPGGAGALRRTSYSVDVADPDLAAELAAAGLLEERPGASLGRRPAPTAREDLGDIIRPHIGFGDRLAFAASIVANGRRYHGRALKQIIAVATARGEGPSRFSGAPPDQALLRQAMIFERLLPWAPRQEACLYRSFMLLQFLGELGRDANWVFGVRTRPFEAHCWIQAGGVVLDDSVDHVASFAPILVT
ncbi:MAG: lasso peptide biosynthesis B2 protein [Caulobacter sp.]|nr:lasso peptide biosynthesis B2 protein [Caulobacter sp.]